MQCPNCAAQVPDGSVECPNCQIIFSKWAKKQAVAPAPLAPAPAASPAPAVSMPPQGDSILERLQPIVIDLPGGRMEYAGYWRRIGAAVVDGWVLTILFGVFFSPKQILLLTVLNWIYFTVLESSAWRATPGKKLFGLSVTDRSGGQISFATANKRYWTKPVWMFLVWIRCAFAFITGNKEYGANAILEKPFWHDRFAGTLVLKKAA